MKHNLRDAKGKFATEPNAVKRVRAAGEPLYRIPIKPTFTGYYEARQMKFRLPKKLAQRGWRIGKLVMSPSQSKVQVMVYRKMKPLALDRMYTLEYQGRAL